MLLTMGLETGNPGLSRASMTTRSMFGKHVFDDASPSDSPRAIGAMRSSQHNHLICPFASRRLPGIQHSDIGIAIGSARKSRWSAYGQATQ